MKSILTTVYDAKAKYFTKPILMATEAEAIREFTQEVNNQESKLFLYSEDFALFSSGTWDPTTGTIEPLSTPQCLTSAIAVKKPVSIQNNVLPLKNSDENLQLGV